MVSKQEVERQLKKLHFNTFGWGKAEVKELPDILVKDEQISELVNGVYEGGFALLVATNLRVLLVDKKPLNYLTIEDLRFDMINEIDYSHRLFGAQISISTGSKNLRFRSYNQPKLRELISHVQRSMAESKQKESSHQEGQNQHLEQINQQLQTYLIAQHRQQQETQERLRKAQEQVNAGQPVTPIDMPEPVKPEPGLADYLYAQSLLSQYQSGPQPQQPSEPPVAVAAQAPVEAEQPRSRPDTSNRTRASQMAELYAEGMQEVFGKHVTTNQQSQEQLVTTTQPQAPATPMPPQATVHRSPSLSGLTPHHPIDLSAISIAYSKLPMALRNRKFGSPSFHAHSQQPSEGTVLLNQDADAVI